MWGLCSTPHALTKPPIYIKTRSFIAIQNACGNVCIRLRSYTHSTCWRSVLRRHLVMGRAGMVKTNLLFEPRRARASGSALRRSLMSITDKTG